MEKEKISAGWWAIANSILLLIKENESKEEVKERVIQLIDDMYSEFS